MLVLMSQPLQDLSGFDHHHGEASIPEEGPEGGEGGEGSGRRKKKKKNRRQTLPDEIPEVRCDSVAVWGWAVRLWIRIWPSGPLCLAQLSHAQHGIRGPGQLSQPPGFLHTLRALSCPLTPRSCAASRWGAVV